MRIPDEKIDEVRHSLDIVDVVGDYVRLKRRGSNWVGLCPFHNEKSPSFNVNPKIGAGIYKCFGCGAGGDVFSFIQEIETVDFLDSVRLLADKAGVELPEGDEAPGEEASQTEAALHALRFAARFYHRQLTQTDEGEKARRYLKERGFEKETITRFGIGYAPDSWDALLKEAEREHVSPQALLDAGLVRERRKGDGYYDAFRGRVLFPILSPVGKVLGFGGRILEGQEDQPKYINTGETLVYHKSKVLYGLYQGKSGIRKEEEAILVEGYTDVTALHQAGVDHAVATCGTALTADQVRVLGRYAKRVLLLYDADEAGTRAAIKAVDLVLTEGLAAYVVSLPEGTDPDAYVAEEGAEAFRDYVRRHRLDFVTFQRRQADAEGLLETPEGEAEAMHRVVASLATITDPLAQETYLRRTAEVFRIPEGNLRRALSQQEQEEERRSARRRPEPVPHAPTPAGDTGRGPVPVPPAPTHEEPERFAPPLPEEQTLLRLMLEHGTPLVELVLGNMSLDEFTEGPVRQLCLWLIETYQEEGAITPAHRDVILQGEAGMPLQALATDVLVDRYEPSEYGERVKDMPRPRLNDDPKKSAVSAMKFLKLDRLREVFERLHAEMYAAQQRGDEQSLRQIAEQTMALNKLKGEVASGAFLDWYEAE